MTTSFSWIDGTTLPQLDAQARLQPLRDANGVPTPGGLVCPAAAHTAMAIELSVPVINPMFSAFADYVAARTCGACGAQVAMRANSCGNCDLAPPKRCDLLPMPCSENVDVGQDQTAQNALAPRHVVAPALFARPTSTMPDGRPNDDDLTKHPACIVRMDNRCRRVAMIHGYASSSHCAARHQLQRAVHKYFGSATGFASTTPDTDSRVPTPVSNRLNGKTGRMRGSLLGWRLGDVALRGATGACRLRSRRGHCAAIHCQVLGQPAGRRSVFAEPAANSWGWVDICRPRVSRNRAATCCRCRRASATLNLDFDGDEVNLHVIKSAQAQFEARLLCGLDSIMRCRITKRVRLKPCHAHVVAHWLKPTPHYDDCTNGHPTKMLQAMARCGEDAETALRQVAVSVGLSDVLPVPSRMLGAVTSVPKSQHVAHLAQILALEPPRGGLTLVRSAKGKFTHLVQLKVCWGNSCGTRSGTARHAVRRRSLRHF